MPCYLPFGNAGGLQLLCCQGFEVKNYDVTLDALNLKPSDVCNVGDTNRQIPTAFALAQALPSCPQGQGGRFGPYKAANSTW
ncbi:MAG: hypothetical protein PVH37_01550 [Desulfobacterales bacterium]